MLSKLSLHVTHSALNLDRNCQCVQSRCESLHTPCTCSTLDTRTANLASNPLQHEHQLSLSHLSQPMSPPTANPSTPFTKHTLLVHVGQTAINMNAAALCSL